MSTSTPPTLAVERVRHTVQVRRLRVREVQQPSPQLVRVRFEGEALRGFVSASFDDHAKLMLPAQPGQPLVLPQPGAEGLVWPADGERPAMRDYTPRAFDADAGWLDIEFVLHGEGLASRWAESVRPGDEVGLGGPRGSFVVPTGFDWHLLVGDETALPAIARRLEELPANTAAIVIAETGDPRERRELRSAARLQTSWVQAGDSAALARAVAALRLPAGEGFAWAAGEAASMAAVREALVGGHGLDKSRVRASAYWKRGSAGHHETLG